MRGADMVEFDIVLTKDKIPIIYHDFQFCINNTESDDTVKTTKRWIICELFYMFF
jgi:glycerophosphoryl diester phosphodiesterase